jgi:hypothetical protein
MPSGQAGKRASRRYPTHIRDRLKQPASRTAVQLRVEPVKAAAIGTLVGLLVVVGLVVSGAVWQVGVCDGYGWPITRLRGDDGGYIDPPPFSVEVWPGCFLVPWWAG